MSGHPSATSRAQDSESTSAKDRCSTAGPRNVRGTSSIPEAKTSFIKCTLGLSFDVVLKVAFTFQLGFWPGVGQFLLNLCY